MLRPLKTKKNSMKKLSLLLVSLTLPICARGASSTLDFEQFLGILGDNDPLPGDYGNRLSNTPHVQVSWSNFDGVSETVPNAFFWTTGVGDLQNVGLSASDGGNVEITFKPDPGFGVSLRSFNMAGWLARDIP